MTVARDYLRTGELTVARIARRTGYASPNVFSAAFRRHHGQPPGQWQRGELARPPEPIHGGGGEAVVERGAPKRGLAVTPRLLLGALWGWRRTAPVDAISPSTPPNAPSLPRTPTVPP